MEFLSTTSSAELLLKPYLEATLALTPSPSTQPLFTVFYIQHPPPPPPPSSSLERRNFLVTPPPASRLPDAADSAATNAETVFWEAVSVLKSVPRSGEEESLEIDNFWPSQNAAAEEEAEEEW
jgi:Rab proteins geranylgeranyltransferase component A